MDRTPNVITWRVVPLVRGNKQQESGMPSVLWWSMVLIGLLIVAFAVVTRIKKRLIRPDEPAGGGFTLADLRALHRNGKITDKELAKAKQAVLAAAQRAAERQAQEKKDISTTNRLIP